MPSPTRRARALALSAIAAAAIGLAACGDDDDDTTTSATTTTGTTEAETTTTETTPTDAASIREQFDDQLSTMLSAQGLSEAQVDCAISELGEAISDEQLQEAVTSGDLAQLADDAQKAAEACREAE
jgi:hypothetical protein